MQKLTDYLDQHNNSIHARFKAIQDKPYFPCKGAPEIVGAWHSMIKIFRRSYWTRTWSKSFPSSCVLTRCDSCAPARCGMNIRQVDSGLVQQEAIAFRIRFFCGFHSFDGKNFGTGCLVHRLCTHDPEFFVPGDYTIPHGLDHARINRVLAVSKSTQSVSLCLVPILKGLRETFCSDPRDKVFATISRASDVTPDRFKVDYGKSLAEVYISVVHFALNFWRGLEILGLVAHSLDSLPWSDARPESSEPPIPSWAPDWRRPIWFDSLNYIAQTDTPDRILYEPCPGMKIDGQHPSNVRDKC